MGKLLKFSLENDFDMCKLHVSDSCLAREEYIVKKKFKQMACEDNY